MEMRTTVHKKPNRHSAHFAALCAAIIMFFACGILTGEAYAASGGYTVTIPKSISYENMSAGAMNVSDTFDVAYEGTHAVDVYGTASAMTGGEGDITVSVASQSNSIAFTSARTATDTISMTGVVRSADTWTGTVSYTCFDKSHLGTAYAVLTNSGGLVFFRSQNEYTAGVNQTVTDINGVSYSGEVYTGIETSSATTVANAPWSSRAGEVVSARVATGQVVVPLSCAYWFQNCNAMTSIDLTGLDTSNVTTMSYMFDGCASLPSIDVSGFDTSKVTHMNYMFRNCSSLTSLDLSNFNTSAAKSLMRIFAGCTNLTTLDISSFDSTNMNKLGMSYWFVGTVNLSSVTLGANFKFASSSAGGFLDPDTASGKYSGLWVNSSVPDANGVTAADLRDHYDGSQTTGDYARGTYVWQKSEHGTAYAVLDDNGALTFFRSMNNYTSGTVGTVTDLLGNSYTGKVLAGVESTGQSISSVPWNADMASIKSISVAKHQSIAPVSTAYWFDGATSLETCDISGVEASELASSTRMFAGCASLETVYVHSGCDWANAAQAMHLASNADMFDGCTSLVGGNGTVCSPSVPGTARARIDGLGGGAGYFTLNPTWGNAYAVLEGSGKLTLLRSEEAHLDGTGQTITDIAGDRYMGQVYTGIETWDPVDQDTSSSAGPWYSQKSSITSVDVADGQTISPINTSRWFWSCQNIGTCDLDGLDTSKVTRMNKMFCFCSGGSFRLLGTSDWDTSSVTDMNHMFDYCFGESFTGPDTSNWDTSNVTDMNNMFDGCYGAAFTAPDVSKWDTSNVTNMSFMFCRCYGDAFTAPDVSGWDTSSVTNMSGLFAYCSGNAFSTPNVSKWDTSSVTDMRYMFQYCSGPAVTAPDVSRWNTSKVTYMNSMFSGCSSASFTAPDVSKWDTSSATDMNHMFSGCSGAAFTAPNMSIWDTSKVTSMEGMFSGCSGTTFTEVDVSGMDVSSVTNTSYMFSGCGNLKTIYADPSADWNAIPTITNSTNMFQNCTNLKGGNGTAYDGVHYDKAYARVDGMGGQPGYFTINSRSGVAYAALDADGKLTLFRSMNSYTAGPGQTVTDIRGNSYTGQVYTDIETTDMDDESNCKWEVEYESVTSVDIADRQVIAPINTAYWFDYCSNLGTCDLDGLDTSNVTNMSYMFDNCSGASFKVIGVSNWDTSKVTSMSYMFSNCSGAEFTAPDVSKWDTSSVTDMSNMFMSCNGAAFTTPDVSEWDTSSVADMSYVFANCSGASFTAPDVSNWDTSSVVDMRHMFYKCNGAAFSAPDVSKWDTSSVTNMRYMFHQCGGDAFTMIDVSGWDISNVRNMFAIFSGCTNLETIYASSNTDWSTSLALTNSGNMFANCTKLKGGDGTVYDAVHQDKSYARVDGLNGSPGYFTAKEPSGTNSVSNLSTQSVSSNLLSIAPLSKPLSTKSFDEVTSELDVMLADGVESVPSVSEQTAEPVAEIQYAETNLFDPIAAELAKRVEDSSKPEVQPVQVDKDSFIVWHVIAGENGATRLLWIQLDTAAIKGCGIDGVFLTDSAWDGNGRVHYLVKAAEPVEPGHEYVSVEIDEKYVLSSGEQIWEAGSLSGLSDIDAWLAESFGDMCTVQSGVGCKDARPVSPHAQMTTDRN